MTDVMMLAVWAAAMAAAFVNAMVAIHYWLKSRRLDRHLLWSAVEIDRCYELLRRHGILLTEDDDGDTP